jgi:hypothetical protein
MEQIRVSKELPLSIGLHLKEREISQRSSLEMPGPASYEPLYDTIQERIKTMTK